MWRSRELSDVRSSWRTRLAGYSGPWAPLNNLLEVAKDPQVWANGYLTMAKHAKGDVALVRTPVQID